MTRTPQEVFPQDGTAGTWDVKTPIFDGGDTFVFHNGMESL
jgi:hypothetical protein